MTSQSAKWAIASLEASAANKRSDARRTRLRAAHLETEYAAACETVAAAYDEAAAVMEKAAQQIADGYLHN